MGRILVVDDDVEIRNILRNLLESAGFEVQIASNGRDAIDRFKANPADIIITDIVMPEMDGLTMIVGLKNEFPDVKIIVTSSGGPMKSDTLLDIAEEIGAVQGLLKPFNKDELLEVIKSTLES
ncbi:MAG: response regulator [Calditrichaeota bacterium]|nr:response regulator [Calditrichota bacterium]